MGGVNFQNAPALLWLFPLVGGLVLLYLLRIKRQQKIVPASFLWPSVSEDVRANSLFQKLKLSWLFILQLLALVVLTIALARPQVQDSGLLGNATVFVIDASESMGAKDVAPDRISAAVALVRQTIQKMQPTDQVAIIEAGTSPRVASALSSDPGQHLAALDTIRVSDTAGHIDEALRLASALVSADEGGKIVVVSDGCFAPVEDFSAGKAAVVFRQIGDKDDNLAVEALSAADTKEGRLLYAGVHNHGSSTLSGTLELYADTGLIDNVAISVEPHQTWGRTVSVPRDAKVYQAKIKADDLLESDNYAACAAPGTGQVHALLISPGDLFLERALSLDSRVTLDRAAKTPKSLDGYDLVVFDEVKPVPSPARFVLSFGDPAGPIVSNGAATTASFVNETQDPIVDGVEFQSFGLGDLPATKLVAGRSLVDTSSGPAVAVTNDGSQTWVHSTIAPLKSEFPLSVSFPIFIGNILDIVASRPATDALTVAAGQTFALPAKESVQLVSPAGRTTSLKPEGSQIVVREVNQTGQWTLKTAKGSIPVFASALTAADSDLKPRTSVQLGTGEKAKLAKATRSADQWKPFLLLALAVLCLEWWVFVRKS